MVACDTRTRSLFLWVGLVLALGMPGTSRSVSPVARAVLADESSLRAMLRTPDDRIDLAQAKLAIDRLIDPDVDALATLRQMDTLSTHIKARFPDYANSEIKLGVLLASLAQPGPWNDYRPFSYDFDDPFGKNIHNKLLSTYLASRKGNCVSMPIMLVILAQKLGLNMTLATAPAHVLAKFRNDDGQWINIEATSFGTKRDASYQQELNISPKAMSNRIYLRPLSKRESVALMMDTLMEFYAQQDLPDRRIEIADLALQINPKDVRAMLQKGNSYFLIMHERYVAQYPSPADIPSTMRRDFEDLGRKTELWFARAEELGWTPPTQTQDADYLRTIQRTKAARQKDDDDARTQTRRH